uniref:tyrosine-type recombinase/integrase n=1 Tax=Sneathiella sp. TaxID=1964365 RepID=UPI003566B973
SQSDAATLTSSNINWRDGVLTYERAKLADQYIEAATMPARIRIGPRLRVLLEKLPKQGPLFPHISQIGANHRASEFRRRCRQLAIEGISLHSFRYSWAERAKAAGYPQRWAQSALGHNSRAVHDAYARGADITCPSLEEYSSKIIPFDNTQQWAAQR